MQRLSCTQWYYKDKLLIFGFGNDAKLIIIIKLVKNIKPMSDFKFTIGQLVAVKNHPYFQEGKKPEDEPLYIGTTISCSSDNYPLMLIKECVKSIQKKQEVATSSLEVLEKQYLEEKYLCSWYDSTLGKFEEAWFKSDVLIKFPNELLTSISSAKSNLLKKVFLRTTLIERYKKVSGTNNRQNDRFVSSSFIIKEFNNENQYEWINKEFGHCEKLISKTKAKVQWFNVAKGKYSEEWLPIEFFQETPNLINIQRNKLNNEPEFWNGSKLMDLISDKKYNFHPQNSEDGKSLEDLIYFYIISERKIILDERVHAFDKYLSENRLLIVNYKIHVNSTKYNSFKPFFSQLDLLLKKEETSDFIAIDIISGNGLLKDENIQPLAKTPENADELSGLALYNGRAFVIQELLKEKYEMSNLSSKLLIINSKLPNLIKELPVLDCTFSLERVTK